MPRVEEVILVPAGERHCSTCACPKCAMGFDVTEVLDMKPVELFVRVIKREKLACPAHPENGVSTGPLGERIVPGGKLSDAFIVDALSAPQPLMVPPCGYFQPVRASVAGPVGAAGWQVVSCFV